MLQRASCRKAVCRIELHWSPDQSQNYLTLYQTINEQFGAEVGVEPFGEVGEDNGQSLYVYVLREGYALQDLQQ
jgi:hypothetical protein